MADQSSVKMLSNGVAVGDGFVILPSGKTIDTSDLSASDLQTTISALDKVPSDKLDSFFSSSSESGNINADSIKSEGLSEISREADDGGTGDAFASGLAKGASNMAGFMGDAFGIAKGVNDDALQAIKSTGALSDSQMSKVKKALQILNPAATLSDPMHSASKKLGQESEKIGKDVPAGVMNSVASAVGSIVPAMAMPYELPEALGGELLSGASSIPGKAGSYLLKTAPTGAAIGAASSPDNSRVSGAIEGAILNPAIGGAMQLGKSAIGYSTPEAFAKRLIGMSSSTEEQIKSALKGSPSGDALVGEALNLPGIQQMEVNTLPTFPVLQNNMIKRLSGISEGINSQAAQIMSDNTIPGINNNQVGKQLLDNMAAGEASATDQARQLYSRVDSIASDEGLEFSYDSLYSKAQDMLDKYSKEKKNTGLGFSEKMQSVLDDVISASEGGADGRVDITGKKIKKAPSSISDLISTRSGLMKEASKAAKEADKSLESFYLQLGGSVDDAITAPLPGGASENLLNAHDEAKNYFKENVVPYRDKKYTSFLDAGKDTDKIASTFLPESGKDSINLLQTFLQSAPGSEDLLLSQFFSKAVETDKFGDQTLNPQKLSNLIKKLGPQRASMLISDPEKLETMASFQQNIAMNKQVLDVMTNYPTGKSTIANNNKAIAMKWSKQILESVLNRDAGAAFSQIGATLPIYMGAKNLTRSDLLQKVLEAKQSGKDTGQLSAIQQAISKAVTSLASGE